MTAPRPPAATPASPASSRPSAERGWGPSFGYLGAALALLAAGIGMVLTAPAPVASLSAAAGPEPAGSRALPPATAQMADASQAQPVAARTGPQALRAPGTFLPASTRPAPAPAGPDPADATTDLSQVLDPGEVPTMADVIGRLQRAGIQGGLAAFPPPGTRPPLVGLAVPDDFVVPEGYVRHHQATDDGQRIEPILMFSPDRRLVDASGQPIAIPPDRVVPAALAPPGLPIRTIVIPAPVDSRSPSR